MSAQFSSPIFQFRSHHIRTAIIDDQPWFAAVDVCRALEIPRRGNTLNMIPDGWKCSMRNFRMEGFATRDLTFISEPAVYKLAFRSNKPEADAFTNWVASDVLPSIRKTGKFAVKDDGRKALGKGLEEMTQCKPKSKALPPAQPFIPEKGREAMERMLALRGTLYRVSSEMRDIIGAPFWDTPLRPCPEHFKPFAKAMNSATWAFVMSVDKELETAALLFEAFVEAEKVLRA